MTSLRIARGRKESDTPSGYERLFGNRKLGFLLSKCHATVISSGNELERFLATKLINTHGISIYKINKDGRVFRGIKRGKNSEVDIVIEKDNIIFLIELKDGDTFDTKKVAGEVESLLLAKTYLSKKYPKKDIKIKFCSFNARDHKQIEYGAKGLLPNDSAMTGRELCESLGLNFDQIVEERKKYEQDNLIYFLEELLNISEVKEKIKKLLRRDRFLFFYILIIIVSKFIYTF